MLYAHPITGSQTFKPSGDPVNDPPERPRESVAEQMRRESGLDTPEGRDARDAWFAERFPDWYRRNVSPNAYYERIRFNPSKPGKGKPVKD